MAGSTFQTNPFDLHKLLDDCSRGVLQLHTAESSWIRLPPVILGAAATRTQNIRLTSAVTVLSAADPVRIFQEFATLDWISQACASRFLRLRLEVQK